MCFRGWRVLRVSQPVSIISSFEMRHKLRCYGYSMVKNKYNKNKKYKQEFIFIFSCLHREIQMKMTLLAYSISCINLTQLIRVSSILYSLPYNSSTSLPWPHLSLLNIPSPSLYIQTVVSCISTKSKHVKLQKLNHLYSNRNTHQSVPPTASAA